MSAATVLVVGAGPTGLTLAVELARRGISVRVIDKAAAASTDTRALGMQARTLELYERHGITTALLDNGLRAQRFNVYSEGRRILRADFHSLQTRYPYLLMIPQNDTEAILAARLADLGVRIERRVALDSITQSPDGVTAVLTRADGSAETAILDWVIGADGAHSTVRRALDVEFMGSAFEENFAVADLRIGWDRPAEEFFAFLNRGRFAAFFPMLGGWHRVAIAQPHAAGRQDRSITHAELQQSISDSVPGSAVIEEVRQAGLFRINQRRAASHRLGRVFLAGDAAHIHSVIGAQGMNTGIQDAFNLGWKLAEVITGTADPGLLDTYASERAPVAERLVRATRRVTRLTLVKHPLVTAARRHVAPLLLARRPVQVKLTRAISQLDVSYHDHRGSAPAGRAAVGDRAPDTPASTGTRVHELLHPTAHTLFSVAVPDDEIRSALGDHDRHVHVVPLPAGSPAARAYGLPRPAVVVVRPDGYVAARAPRNDLSAVRAYLDRVFLRRESHARLS
ncbi:FAD-dependent oxidoreductase [Pseudactinotalea terrae]|uniref:FAD-dependent oxidoreductase n=1 Tax=Pseudactinotalea terrae TaxID=1743262 RepID=UPI0012E2589D|nr:FAD-dependent oxidoreductase [Pseudactinotalea terrae]